MSFVADPVPRLRSRLAWQMPLAVALAVLAVAAVGIRPALVVALYLAAITGELGRVDLAEHRLPNTLVAPGYWFALVGLCWDGLVTGAIPWIPLISGAGFFIFLLLMNLAGGMGMGDVKLAGVLGLSLGSLGAGAAVVGPLIGFVLGGIAGFAVLVLPGTGALHRIPFGPFLLLGFWVAVALVGVYT